MVGFFFPGAIGLSGNGRVGGAGWRAHRDIDGGC